MNETIGRGGGWPPGPLEAVLNAALRLDPEWHVCLEPLVDRVFELRVEPAGTTVRVRITSEGVRAEPRTGAAADVTLSGAVPVLLAAARAEVLPAGLHVSGDLALAQLARRQLARLDLDWEEAIARLTGDLAGRQIGRAIRAGAAWGGRTGAVLGQDLAEYLTEEARLLVARWPVERFCNEVDTLRDDLDRLEQRVARLAREVGGAPP